MKMDDTSPEMRKKQREIILSKTPQERFLMGLQMMEDAREIVLNSIGWQTLEYPSKI